MKLLKKIAVVVVALGSASVGLADLNDAGDITIDTTSGLEWLDLRFTYGLSYNSIYADGGLAETDNWRHATDAELRALLTSSLGLPLDTVLESAATGTWTEVIAFLNLIGPAQTATFGGDGKIKTVYSVKGYLDSPRASENVLAVGLLQAADGTVVAVGPFATLLQTQLNGTGVGADQGLSSRGHFLVRETMIAPEMVNIDIKPGGDPNCFNVNGHGVIPVAVLGSDSLDVIDVDISSLSFGGLAVRVRGNKGPQCGYEDSNDDGKQDLVCQFEDDPSAWNVGSDSAILSGVLLDGSPFEGSDSICVVP